ncbi:MAG: hypothetical protein R6U66_07665 [Bacteroidales bacterium]
MKGTFKRFVIAELLVLGVIILLGGLLYAFVFPSYYTPHVLFVPPFLLAASLFLFRLHASSTQVRDAQFTSRYMMTNGVKMMVYLIAIVIYAFVFPENAHSFLITFLICYFSLTTVEVIFVLRLVKQSK